MNSGCMERDGVLYLDKDVLPVAWWLLYKVKWSHNNSGPCFSLSYYFIPTSSHSPTCLLSWTKNIPSNTTWSHQGRGISVNQLKTLSFFPCFIQSAESAKAAEITVDRPYETSSPRNPNTNTFPLLNAEGFRFLLAVKQKPIYVDFSIMVCCIFHFPA